MIKPVLFLVILFIIIKPVMANFDPDCMPELNTSGVFDVRHSIPNGTDFKSLLNNPKELVADVSNVRLETNPFAVRSKTDFHAVYPVEMEKFRDTIADYENYKNTLPRIADSLYVCGNGFNPFKYQKSELVVEIKFMGLGVSYDYVYNVFPIDDKENGVYATKWNLEEELDEKFFELYGSWYLKKITLDGKPHTYVRYYVRTGFNKLAIPGSVLEAFIDGDIKALMNAAYKAAKKR